ncbi:hypothetical protein F4803DRAFT_468599 [Xylaria telfairii]|nr:hypothetical protein F4803DRAFT_468599 [Xylaria telfairii]
MCRTITATTPLLLAAAVMTGQGSSVLSDPDFFEPQFLCPFLHASDMNGQAGQGRTTLTSTGSPCLALPCLVPQPVLFGREDRGETGFSLLTHVVLAPKIYLFFFFSLGLL